MTVIVGLMIASCVANSLGRVAQMAYGLTPLILEIIEASIKQVQFLPSFTFLGSIAQLVRAAHS